MSHIQPDIHLPRVKKIKVYTALLNQTGTGAPTAKVLQNTMGGTIVWTRINPGQYHATLTGVFTLDKTWVIVKALDNNSYETTNVYINTDIIQIQTRIANVLSDNVLIDTEIEIRVYVS